MSCLTLSSGALAPGRSEKMPASDERSRHGNVLDDVLREEIKDLTPEQVKRVLEYIETLKQQ